jgi:hypothetical protein
MEAVGLAASIVQVLELTAELVRYLNSVKNANKEQRTLEAEAASVYGVLVQLKRRVEDADEEKDWFKTVRVLGEPNGALDQYDGALQKLQSKVKDTSTVSGKIVHAVTWKFRKDDVEGVLASIERVKLTANLALTNDLLYVYANALVKIPLTHFAAP